MKVSRKGIIIIVAFLVVLPLSIDFILSKLLPENEVEHFAMTKFLFGEYAKDLPLYFLYLIIAFGILYVIRNYIKNKKS